MPATEMALILDGSSKFVANMSRKPKLRVLRLNKQMSNELSNELFPSTMAQRVLSYDRISVLSI